LSQPELLELYRAYYARAPFVRVVDHLPATKHTTGTNFLDVTVRVVRDRFMVLVVEDNLIRGASGVAVQNFNRMYGYDEKTGLL
jgi:N-acetyl-gamma-glutamyl-phosphate reductase